MYMNTAYIYIYIDIHAYIYTYIYIYVYTYMHTITDISKGSLMTPPQNQDPLDKVNTLISSNIRQQVYM
jgi:hypothetical protein